MLSLQQPPDRFWAHSVSYPVDFRKFCIRQQVTDVKVSLTSVYHEMKYLYIKTPVSISD